MPSTGAKRGELMLYEDRARVAELMHQGIKSPQEIADIINQGRPEQLRVSRKTISKDIEWIRQQWKEAAIFDFNAYQQQAWEELEYLKRQAYQELRQSRTPKITTTKEASANVDDIDAILNEEEFSGDVQITKTISKEENREGNVAYMQLIRNIILDQLKLRGADGPTKFALTDSKGQDLDSVKTTILEITGKMRKDLLTSHDNSGEQSGIQSRPQ